MRIVCDVRSFYPLTRSLGGSEEISALIVTDAKAKIFIEKTPGKAVFLDDNIIKMIAKILSVQSEKSAFFVSFSENPRQ